MKLDYTIKAIKYVRNVASWWIIYTAGINIALGFVPITQVWLTKELINALNEIFQRTTESYSHVIGILLVQFLLIFISSGLEKVKTYMDKVVELKLTHNLQKNVLEKMSSVPYSYFDKPEFYDHLNRIQSGQGENFMAPIKNLFEIFKTTISVISLIIYLASIHWLLIVLSVLIAFPVLYLRSKMGIQRFNLIMNQTPMLREIQYIQSIIELKQSSKEIRLFGLKDYLLQRWSKRYQEKESAFLNLYRKDHLQSISLDVIIHIFYACAAIFIISMGRINRITIGDFFAIIQAVQATQGGINQISSGVASIYEESLYIRDYFQFIDFHSDLNCEAEGILPFPTPLKKGINLENVSHCYQGSKQKSISEVTLSITPGEKVAIVGENGSGKTTLIKCLIGLYQVDEGQILYDNIPINKLNKKSLWENTAVLFQDFMQYAFTVRENIAFGNVKRLEDHEWLEEVSKISGIEEVINDFDKKYETYLGKYLFEGEDLSGGLWQRIALARATFRNGQIVIFDEPTAALDPYAELNFFKQLRNLTKDKTTIFVTHRIVSAKIADRIIVMKNGQVVEMGGHEELMERKQEYYRMYQSQSKWYSDHSSELQELVGWKS
ncbi:ABC transporter ATP-binding protein [Brevibacillus sp. MS2.2]|uniref:ABC transporter ATP-binding protein n=1 Tax=Brevibacillus sp. MS2.2 TaxID=2738981 RepID=UPI00156AFC09|nr:ABC transporter ATP-binding protein [Brevibacillus sp. MS2.2]NRR24373.1 ABC transporter ATP-binding protein [Brevibacillus sp. MS2.2]